MERSKPIEKMEVDIDNVLEISSDEEDSVVIIDEEESISSAEEVKS